ncbi:MAG: SDR family oxidoreductase [Caldilineaceae bacterium]|nr:SDR family oxidoreductase [Caldilineaceae bacterium]MDE0336229.1 SDR family oxidoreductase [Caldilineaceae bacterium]
MSSREQFSLDGKVAVITGGTGVLGGAMARGLAEAGARVAILGRREAKATEIAGEITAADHDAIPLPADVLDEASLRAARQILLDEWGSVDVLINCAGGNRPDATVFGDLTFFNVPRNALEGVVGLNFTGTVLPTQVFGELMAERGRGSIINISSMASQKVLTRVMGYSAAKAAVDNLTRWLAVDLAEKHGPGLRVNAIAPGFFIGEQNRALLIKEDAPSSTGDSPVLTERGQQIVDHTPMGRFGEPDELVGAAIWLASDASRFVTGIVVPVDGGFSAASGI